jgi:hypothetical protein
MRLGGRFLGGCFAIYFLAGASPAPTTLPEKNNAEATIWMRRAADEAARVDDPITRADEAIHILLVRAQVDTAADSASTIEAYADAIGQREAGYKERDGSLPKLAGEPDDTQASVRCYEWYNLAKIYALRNLTEGRKIALERAQKYLSTIKPMQGSNVPLEAYRIILVQALGGDLAAAERTLDEIQPLARRADFTQVIASNVNHFGRKDDAVVLAERGLENIRDDTEKPSFLVETKLNLLVLTGKFDQARELSLPKGSTGWIISRFDVSKYLYPAIAEFSAGDKEGSLADVQRAIAVQWDDPTVGASQCEEWARKLAKIGDQKGMQLLLDHASNLLETPKAQVDQKLLSEMNAFHQCAKVEALAVLGDVDGAKTAFATITLFPTDVMQWSLQCDLATSEVKARRFDEAQAMLHDMDKKGPEEIHRALAREMSRAGKIEEFTTWFSTIPLPEQKAESCLGVVEGLLDLSVEP